MAVHCLPKKGPLKIALPWWIPPLIADLENIIKVYRLSNANRHTLISPKASDNVDLSVQDLTKTQNRLAELIHTRYTQACFGVKNTSRKQISNILP